ncbi:hypothetical protein [Halalkalibacter urbisdiaboli]|uniref:hypothetical protein n=1 Tax=Halalkalibacter urbisdiaboli TaxID=1960589 RepID=UPI000B453C0D|nr:hypothetical protein [Halalkalibacter urbisdiaboli]
MDALILLLMSICLVTTYGLVYILLRMRKGMDDADKTVMKKSVILMLSIAFFSGVSAISLFFLGG